MFQRSEESKRKSLTKKYWKYQSKQISKAQQFVRKKCKEVNQDVIVHITKLQCFPKTLDFCPQLIQFELYPRLSELIKPQELSKAEWVLYKKVLQWSNDEQDIKTHKKNKMRPRKFLMNVVSKKKNEKCRPSMFIAGTPKEIVAMGKDVLATDRKDLSKLIPYLNPDFLDYEENRYYVTCTEEMNKCHQEKRKTQKNPKQRKKPKKPKNQKSKQKEQ